MNNPHDKFFKDLFSRKSEAISFIKGVFPKKLIEQIDLSSLQPDETSYVDKQLYGSYSDFVYNCTYGEQNIKVVFHSILIYNYYGTSWIFRKGRLNKTPLLSR